MQDDHVTVDSVEPDEPQPTIEPESAPVEQLSLTELREALAELRANRPSLSRVGLGPLEATQAVKYLRAERDLIRRIQEQEHPKIHVTHEQDEAIPDEPVPLDQMTVEELGDALDRLRARIPTLLRAVDWTEAGRQEVDLIRRIQEKKLRDATKVNWPEAEIKVDDDPLMVAGYEPETRWETTGFRQPVEQASLEELRAALARLRAKWPSIEDVAAWQTANRTEKDLLDRIRRRETVEDRADGEPNEVAIALLRLQEAVGRARRDGIPLPVGQASEVLGEILTIDRVTGPTKYVKLPLLRTPKTDGVAAEAERRQLADYAAGNRSAEARGIVDSHEREETARVVDRMTRLDEISTEMLTLAQDLDITDRDLVIKRRQVIAAMHRLAYNVHLLADVMKGDIGG